VDQQEYESIACGGEKRIGIIRARNDHLSVIKGQRQARDEKKKKYPNGPQVPFPALRFLKRRRGSPRSMKAFRTLGRCPSLRAGPYRRGHVWAEVTHSPNSFS